MKGGDEYDKRKHRQGKKWNCAQADVRMAVTAPDGKRQCFCGGLCGKRRDARGCEFSDIVGHWASEYIAEGTEKNWVNGYPDGTFRPQNTITRAEFVKLILSAMKLTPGSDNAEFLNEVEFHKAKYEPYEITLLSDVKNHWVTTSGYMDIALKYGMVIKEEYSGERFQPDKAITRREIAVMAMRRWDWYIRPGPRKKNRVIPTQQTIRTGCRVIWR